MRSHHSNGFSFIKKTKTKQHQQKQCYQFKTEKFTTTMQQELCGCGTSMSRLQRRVPTPNIQYRSDTVVAGLPWLHFHPTSPRWTRTFTDNRTHVDVDCSCNFWLGQSPMTLCYPLTLTWNNDQLIDLLININMKMNAQNVYSAESFLVFVPLFRRHFCAMVDVARN